MFSQFSNLRRPLAVAMTSALFVAVHTVAAAQQPAANPEMSKADALFNAKKWKEAAVIYRKVVGNQPKNGLAWFRLGYALHAAGDYKQAAEAHAKAATFPKGKATAFYNLACAQALLGNKEAALQALNNAIDAGFKNKKLLQADNDLKSLRKEAGFRKSIQRIDQKNQVYRQFDFWIGDWDVFTKQGKKIGANLIQKAENGHLLIENWKNLKGGTGKSINFVDPADGKWKQVWVDKGGGVVRYIGEFKNGAMRFTGSSINKNGAREIARATFTPLKDGRVRQFIQHSKDGGKTWYTYFDGYYRRKPSSIESKNQN